MAATVEDLHEAVFGYRPAKREIAYERLTAVVLALQGWEQVVHDTTERAQGKLAEHQLDVTGRHPPGEIKHLTVECKDWDKTVGQGTLNTLVGVRTQIGADAAAVITTEGYTQGAIDVAVDESIGLWRLRPFDPGSPVNYVEEVKIDFDFQVPSFSNFDIAPLPDRPLPVNGFRIHLGGDDHLLNLDGSPAETVMDVLRSHAGPLGERASNRRAAFADGRLLPVEEGDPIAIAALTWTETVHSDRHTIVVKGKGNPMLVLEQLDERGELEHGRVVIDRDLFAWDIDADGIVTPRGELYERMSETP